VQDGLSSFAWLGGGRSVQDMRRFSPLHRVGTSSGIPAVEDTPGWRGCIVYLSTMEAEPPWLKGFVTERVLDNNIEKYLFLVTAILPVVTVIYKSR
jgi:hypothetical protein